MIASSLSSLKSNKDLRKLPHKINILAGATYYTNLSYYSYYHKGEIISIIVGLWIGSLLHR